MRIRLIGFLFGISGLLIATASVMSLIGDPGTRSLRLLIVLASLPVMIAGVVLFIVAYRRGQWP